MEKCIEMSQIAKIKPNTTYICGINVTLPTGTNLKKGKEYTSDENGMFTADNGVKLERVGVICGFKERTEIVNNQSEK